MSQDYGLKHTFVEYADPDESRASLRRSDSWSLSSSSQTYEEESSESQPFQSGERSSGHTIERTVFLNDTDSSQSRPAPSSEDDDEAEDNLELAAAMAEAVLEVETDLEVPSERGLVPDALQAKHDSRKCVPCVNIVLHKQCSLGSDCDYCHLNHDGPLTQRPSKEIRKRCKQAVMKVDARYRHSEQDRTTALQEVLSQQNPFMRNYIVKILGSEEGEALDAAEQNIRAAQKNSNRPGYVPGPPPLEALTSAIMPTLSTNPQSLPPMQHIGITGGIDAASRGGRTGGYQTGNRACGNEVYQARVTPHHQAPLQVGYQAYDHDAYAYSGTQQSTTSGSWHAAKGKYYGSKGDHISL